MTRRSTVLLLLGCGIAGAQYRRSSGPRGNAPPSGVPEPAASFAGVLKRIDGAKLLLELSDGNLMEFRTTKKTKYVVDGKTAKVKQLREGDHAEIEGRHAPGAIEAVTVSQNEGKH